MCPPYCEEVYLSARVVRKMITSSSLNIIRRDVEGQLLLGDDSTFRLLVPHVFKQIDIHFLETVKDNLAIFRSKAVGEPPLMYGIGAYFALRNAVKAFNPLADIPYNAPMTPEKVLMSLYQKQ